MYFFCVFPYLYYLFIYPILRDKASPVFFAMDAGFLGFGLKSTSSPRGTSMSKNNGERHKKKVFLADIYPLALTNLPPFLFVLGEQHLKNLNFLNFYTFYIKQSFRQRKYSVYKKHIFCKILRTFWIFFYKKKVWYIKQIYLFFCSFNA